MWEMSWWFPLKKRKKESKQTNKQKNSIQCINTVFEVKVIFQVQYKLGKIDSICSIIWIPNKNNVALDALQ